MNVDNETTSAVLSSGVSRVVDGWAFLSLNCMVTFLELQLMAHVNNGIRSDETGTGAEWEILWMDVRAPRSFRRGQEGRTEARVRGFVL